MTIALNHLPQDTAAIKWYEIKQRNESIAVIQLKIYYSFNYSFTNSTDNSTLTSLPSSSVRQLIKAQSKS